MITYQVEKWGDIERSIKSLVKIQWKELALDQELIPLDPDYDRYAQMDASGALHVTTARDGKRLIGYYVNLVSNHLHYKSTLFGFNDLYYLLPKYRKAAVGIGLFVAMEAAMKERGVTELISITKKHLDVSPLFKALKWRETGITYTKVITG